MKALARRWRTITGDQAQRIPIARPVTMPAGSPSSAKEEVRTASTHEQTNIQSGIIGSIITNAPYAVPRHQNHPNATATTRPRITTMNAASRRLLRACITASACAFVISTASPAVAQSGPGISNRLGDFVGVDAMDPTARADLTRVATYPAAAGTLALAYPQSGNETFDVTTSAALALSFTGGRPGQGQEMVVIVRQPASGGFAVTLPAASATMVWSGGAPPAVSTTAGAVSVFRVYYAGGTYLGGY